MSTAVQRPESIGSDQSTHGVRVRVWPKYVAEQSRPGLGKFVFAYRIAITNQSDGPLQLLRRHWSIVDADGHRHEVEGEGVVGQQPRVEAGETFEYSSFCPLETRWGTMEGWFSFQRPESGAEVRVAVGRFYFVGPDGE